MVLSSEVNTSVCLEDLSIVRNKECTLIGVFLSRGERTEQTG